MHYICQNILRIRICRKEAKETKYWLELILHANPTCDLSINELLKEPMEFIKIFSSILTKVS
jgi:four helix bundle protein